MDDLRKTRIGVIGSSNVDLVVRIERMPHAGETLPAQSFATGLGGKGANQAVAAARLGGNVVFVTRVGDDAFGADLLRHYRDLGLDTRHARAVPGMPTGTATILVEPSGENRILISAGANAALGPADIDEASEALGACGLILLQYEIPAATVAYAMSWAAKAGIDVLLNPAPVVSACPDISCATFVVLNKNELTELTLVSAATRDEAVGAARRLVATGVRCVMVTLGGDGVLVVDALAARHVPAIAVTPLDTTGAGDAFIGAFAERWIATRDRNLALEQAVRYAADSITRSGAQASYSNLDNFLAFRARTDLV